MSLKNRLRVVILGLVIIVVIALSGLYLRTLVDSIFLDLDERAQLVASQAAALVEHRVGELSAARPAPRDIAEAKALWSELIETDPLLPAMLRRMLVAPRAILEIHVVGPGNRILASVTQRPGQSARDLPDFTQWQRRRFWTKLAEVFTKNRDYSLSVPLGVSGQQDRPLFRVEVVISSVLVANLLKPPLRELGLVTLFSLIGSLLLAVAFSRYVSGPLERVSRQIDRIAAGSAVEHSAREWQRRLEGREFATVESKLEMLGQQYRGARENAQQLKGNLEMMFQRLENVVLLFDAAGRLTMAGPPAERLLGIVRSDLIGKAPEQFLDDHTAFGAFIVDAVHQRRPIRDYPLQLDREGAPSRRLLLTAVPLDHTETHEPMGVMVTLEDDETRRQIENQLEVTTRLAAINRVTGGVAHEIKNPLNAIALHLELLKSKLRQAEGDPPPVDEEVKVIAREITRLDRVVKTFLDFTRPLRMKLERVDLSEVASEVVALMTPQAARREIRIELEKPPERVMVSADRDLLQQALLNIVSNAVEAMERPGTVRVEAGCAPFSQCWLKVVDQGCGIPLEQQERIFDLYFTTKTNGSGIGLAMAFRVVQLHQGKIELDSEPGKGSTFRLVFPAADPRGQDTVPLPRAAKHVVTG